MDIGQLGIFASAGLLGSKLLHSVMCRIKCRREAGIKTAPFVCPYLAKHIEEMHAEQEASLRAIQGQIHDLARFLEEESGR